MDLFTENLKSVIMNTTDTKSSKFQSYHMRDIKNIKVLKTTQFLKFSSGELTTFQNRPVLLVNLRNYQLNIHNFENLVKNTKIFKFKSKYILNKIGYIISEDEDVSSNPSNGSLMMIYNLPKGHLLDFDQFIDSKDDAKIFVLERILNILNRVKGGGINYGGLCPEMFIYNPDSDVPLILVDYSYFTIFESNWSNSPEEITKDPNLKLLMGIIEIKGAENNPKPNFIAMILTFLTKIFLDKSYSKISYMEIIIKFYSELNNSTLKKNSVKPGSFTHIVENKISNIIIKNLLLKYTKSHFNSKAVDEFGALYLEFIEQAFKPIKTDSKIEFVLKEFHQDSERNLKRREDESVVFKNFLRNSKLSSEQIHQRYSSLMNNSIGKVKNNYNLPTSNQICEAHTNVKVNILYNFQKTYDIIRAINEHLKNKMNIQTEEVNKKLKGYLQMIHDEEEMENSIQKLEKFAQEIFDKIRRLSAVTNFNQKLFKISSSSRNYLQLVKYYSAELMDGYLLDIERESKKKLEFVSSQLNLEEDIK